MALELSEYDISFEPRTTLKSQVVADFITMLTLPVSSSEADRNSWTVNMDGSSDEKGCGAGVLIQAPNRDRFEYALRFNFPTSNNEVEYDGLIAGLRMAEAMRATHLIIQQFTARNESEF